MTDHHPSVRALLTASGLNDPIDAIRSRARAFVSEAMTLNWEGPPFSMTELASLRNLKVDENADLRDDQDACVMPGRVLLNRRKPGVRRRYSLAHEIGHTLFPDYEEEVRGVGRLWRRDGDDSELERLCQVAAAEFLFPLTPFLAAVGRQDATLSATLTIAGEFVASPEATARRLVETSDAALLAIVVRPVDPETGNWFVFQRGDAHSPYAPLAVASTCYSPATDCVAIQCRTVPPKGSAIERAWRRAVNSRGGTHIECVASESWHDAGIEGVWTSQAVTLPLHAAVPREVLCLMRRA